MANLGNPLRHKLERLFQMSSGYVMDFSNNTFADFVFTSIGLNPYEHYQGSKAVILRQIWQKETNDDVRKLTLDMLERWHTELSFSDSGISNAQRQLYEDVVEEVNALQANLANAADLEFLEREFEVDLSELRVPLSFRQAIEQRLEEMGRCMDAGAPLAVIFLCGSTLEGLLNEVASNQTESFNRCIAAPKDPAGKVRPLAHWSLEHFITTSRELGIIGEDVVKYAYAVKDFRNYIHPRQQVKENFVPRILTAEIAQKVLHAAIADLGSKWLVQ